MAGNRVPPLLVGEGLRMRAATAADAPFILSLRLDPGKNRHLGPTGADLAQQVAWMERMERVPDHRYFIVESEAGGPIGTLRLQIGADGHFGAHSLILAEGAPRGAAMEVARIVYDFALCRGLAGGRFETRTDNLRARLYFERIGARLVTDDERHCHYEVTAEGMRRFLAGRRGAVAAAR